MIEMTYSNISIRSISFQEDLHQKRLIDHSSSPLYSGN